MPSDTALTLSTVEPHSRAGRRFYIGIAFVAVLTALAGFLPAMLDPGSRKGPLTWEVGVHGTVYSAWLALFLAQTLLVSSGRIAAHRVLGSIGAGLAIAMLGSGYFTTMAMVRRGYDLSGDLLGDSGDPLMLMLFQLGDLLCFGILVALGVLFRHRSEVHKRLMVLATVGGLMPAALSHIIGHSLFLRGLHPAIILVPWTAFLFAGAVHDRISTGRIHPISLWGASTVWIWSNLRAVIGTSDWWRAFASWWIGQ